MLLLFYMDVDWWCDYSLWVLRFDFSVKLGMFNVCMGCYVDFECLLVEVCFVVR